MSTIIATNARLTNVQDAAGANGSTPLQLQQGRAKAWFNLNGTGTIAPRDSFNVSSFTDNGVGDYTANFATAQPNAGYAANPSPRIEIAGVSVAGLGPMISFTTAAYRFNTYYVSSTGGVGTASDYGWVADSVFGD